MLSVKSGKFGYILEIAGIMLCAVSTAGAQNVVEITTADQLQNLGSYPNDTTLELKNDIQLTASGIRTFSKKGMVVDGKGHTVTSTNATAWLLSGDSTIEWMKAEPPLPADFTFKNITFADSQKPETTAVIKLTNRATIDLQNFTVRNITANGASDPVWGGIFEISNNGRVSISDSLFENVKITTNNSQFKDSVTGSVLYVQGNEKTIPGVSVVSLIENSKFIDNSLTSSGTTNAFGGAIYVEGRIDKISNSLFQGNSAVSTQENVAAYGGAIAGGGIADYEYARRGTATIGTIGDATQFNQNHVKSAGSGYGGAIYSSGEISSFQGTQFNGNYVEAANAYGGAIASTSFSGVRLADTDQRIEPANIQLIRRAIFNKNYVSATETAQGGAIYSSGNSVYVTGFFNENFAKGDVKAEGGAMYNSKGRMKPPAGTPGDPSDGLVDKVAQYISGEFEKNYVTGALAHGGAIYNEGTIKNVKKIPGYDNALDAKFDGNYAVATNMAVGGGIYNNGKIETMEAIFSNNNVTGVNEARGGGLANTIKGVIDTIVKAKFTSNAAIATGDNGVARGGGLFNNGEDFTGGDYDIGSIDADFADNYASATHEAYGGAFYNGGKVGNIQEAMNKMTFSNNRTKADDISAGGAIYNGGVMGNIMANFVNNQTESVHSAFGGAVYNIGIAKQIDSIFIDNSSTGEAAKGGAFYNNGTITGIGGSDNITSNFMQNRAVATNEAFGGAIYNEGTLKNITADFNDNVAMGDAAMGGAIYTKVADGSTITGTFKNNKANGKSSALGGAVWAVSDAFDKPIEFINTEFTGNRAYLSAGTATRTANQALGGAVFGNALKFTADGDGNEVKFKGNTAGDTNNAVYVAGLGSVGIGEGTDAKVEFAALNSGKISMFDDIDGVNYDMNISGDGQVGSEVSFYGAVDHVKTLQLGAQSVTRLSGMLNAENYTASDGSLMHLGRAAVVNAGNYDAMDGAQLRLDLAVDAANKTVQNGIINVSGDVTGHTQVIVNALNDANYDNMSTKFVDAPNDDKGTAATFDVARVLGSSYAWESKYNYKGDEAGSVWYLAVKEKDNPDTPVSPVDPVEPPVDPDNPHDKPVNPVYEAEIVAYTGLQTVAVEQNRSIADSVANGLAANKNFLCSQKSCDSAELFAKKEAWVNVTHENAKIDAPADIDAKINGATFGLDFYRQKATRAGLFGAYRYGKYDFSGKGDYYAQTGADVNDKSWLAGAYYHYDNLEWQLSGILFAGAHDMDLKTDDRLVYASTDAFQFGANMEAMKRFVLTDTFSLSPSLGLYYTFLDIETLKDNARKQAKFNNLHYLQAELGATLEYAFCHDGKTRRIYAKPSIIRTFVSGGKTRMSDINKPFDSFDEQTLGRMELGGELGINDRWSSSAEVGYTFGDNYESYQLMLGIGYHF